MSSPKPKATINGNVVEVASAASSVDLSGTNYLLVGLTDPSPEQRKAITDAGVSILSLVGDGDTYVYLCRRTAEDIRPLKKVAAVGWLDRYPVSAKIDRDLQDEIDFQLQGAGGSSSDSKSLSAPAGGAGSPSVPVRVRIWVHDEEGSDAASAVAKRLLGDRLVKQEDTKVFTRLVLTTIESRSLVQVAAIDSVLAISANAEKILFNDLARQILAAETPQLAMENGTVYDGAGETICVIDTGFDNGQPWADAAQAHQAFRSETLGNMYCAKNIHGHGVTPEDLKDVDGHGTHVACSAVGSSQTPSSMAAPGGHIRGTAPGAKLFTVRVFGKNAEIEFEGEFRDLLYKTYKDGATIFNSSWGSVLKKTNRPFGYTNDAGDIDRFVTKSNAFVCWAAGNEGQTVKPTECQIGGEALAKNVLTVGACRSSRPAEEKYSASHKTVSVYDADSPPGNPLSMCPWSSGGFFFSNKAKQSPRYKPDVVAPGSTILSARSRALDAEGQARVNDAGVSSDGSYSFKSGTSMASPLVAGCGAVLRQALKDAYKHLPEKDLKRLFGPDGSDGALIKALIINGAVPLSGGGVPDRAWGFGRVNLQASLNHIRPPAGDEVGPIGFALGSLRCKEECKKEFTLPEGVKDEQELDLTKETLLPRLKATLAYVDQPGEIIQCKMHLKVEYKGSHGKPIARFGNMGEKQQPDGNNNVQQVVWPGMGPGKYSISVTCDSTIKANDNVKFGLAWYTQAAVDAIW